jgi:hypothetical protein
MGTIAGSGRNWRREPGMELTGVSLGDAVDPVGISPAGVGGGGTGAHAATATATTSGTARRIALTGLMRGTASL